MLEQVIQNSQVLPTPTLIIPLGEHSIKILVDTLPHYFRNNDRRKNVTSVFTPILQNQSNEENSTGFSILDQNSILSYNSNNSQYTELKLENVQMNINAIKGGLDLAWHNMRSHQNLIRGGYVGGEVPDPNIIILANLWDDTACYALLQILHYIKKLTNQVLFSMVQVLITTANFSYDKDSDSKKARIFRVLEEIDKRILGDEINERDSIYSLIETENTSNLDNIRFIIFDTLKEINVYVMAVNSMTMTHVLFIHIYV